MNQLNFTKTSLLGKTLLLQLLLILMIPAMGQSTACKADFDVKIDHTTKTAVFHAKSNKSPVVFGWTISDGSAYRGERMKHQFTAAGTYKVCLKAVAFDSVTNKRCTTEVCKAITIVDCSRLEAKFDVRIDGKTVKLIGTSNSKHAAYGYDLGDGTIKRGNPIKHTYNRAGEYEICFIVKDTLHGCITKVCKKIRIKKDCDLEAKFVYRQDGKDFKFLAKANQDPARFVWDMGDGTTLYGDEIKHSYKKPGVYKVCLTVYGKSTNSNDICKVEICERVVIKKENDCDLRADFDFKVKGNKIYLEAKSNQKDVHFFWTFGDGHDATGRVQKHKYQRPGVYEVCLIVFNPKTKCKVCVCKKIRIEKPCKLKAEIRTRQSSNKVLFKARSNASSDATYSWDFGDGTKGTGKAIRYKYAKKGVYIVTLVVADKNADCRIVVRTKIYIGVSKASKLNERVIEDKSDLDRPDQKIKPEWSATVYPVPAVGTIDVSSDDKNLTKVKIYSADGSLALEVNKDLRNIDISILTKGFYYAHVYADDGTVKVLKFIKES